MITIGIIIPAAGAGLRFGSPLPKQYQSLGGIPIIVHSVRTALAVEGVVSVVIPLAEGDLWFEDLVEQFALKDGRLHTLPGGTQRQHSVSLAMGHASLAEVDVILVHDAVRPMATVDLFSRVAKEAMEKGAVVPSIALADTIKRVDNETVIETVDRSMLRRIQTPQGFRTEILRSAYERARIENWLCTDDAAVVERTGQHVFCIDGEEFNEKITEPIDLIRAESVLRVYSRPL